MKIPFDIKYCPQIESEEYKVETKNGCQVEILKFGIEGPDFNIAGIIDRIYFDEVASWTNDGMFNPKYLKKESPNDLVLITPEPELTDFECNIRSCIVKHLTTYTKDENGREIRSTVFIDDDTAKEMAAELLELARKELIYKTLDALKETP